MPTRDLRKEARTFVLGAACGFAAGFFALSAVVWQYGNVIGSREAGLRYPADPPAAIARWGDGSSDVDDPVLLPADPSPAPTGTSGGPVPPAPSPEPVLRPPAGAAPELAGRALAIPVQGITADQLTPSFDEPRGGGRLHQAIDILAPRNTPVVAVEDGTVARLFLSRAGGVTIYQFDPTGQYCYYYAHLERYADGLQEGQPVRKGQVIGYVGTSGNAPPDTPHLHFAVYRLTAEQRWWEGTPVDPYELLAR